MTMPWSHVDRMIPEYCDGRLSAEDAARVEGHLERCAACRCAAEDFRFASALLTRLPVTKAPDSLWPGILAGLDARDKKSEKDSRSVFPARRLALAACTVLMIGVATYWYSSRSPSESWQVSATASNGTLSLVVSDDGPGLPPAGAGETGIGLTNTRNRLARLYAGDASLLVESATPRGVRVSVRLPLRVAPSEDARCD